MTIVFNELCLGTQTRVPQKNVPLFFLKIYFSLVLQREIRIDKKQTSVGLE